MTAHSDWRAARAAVLGASAALACTELAPGSDFSEPTLETSAAETSAPGAEGASNALSADAAAPRDDRWACLARPAPARAVPLRGGVTLALAVSDIASGQSPEGLSARACSRLDVQCEAPLASDEGVRLRLELPQGFSGFIEITSASSVPSLYFLSRPLERDGSEALSVVSPSGLRALAESAGVALDEARGNLLVRAFDCDGAPASGVRISNGQLGAAFSFEGGLPRFGMDVTSPEGLVGYVNVPPGLVFVDGREIDAGRACGATSVVVRRGWLTYGDVEPAGL